MAHAASWLVLAGLAAVGQLAAAAGHSNRRHSTLFLRGGGDVKTDEIVSALQGTVKSLDSEQEAQKTRAKSHDKECKETAAQLEDSIKSGTEAHDEGNDDAQAVGAEVDDLEATVSGLKSKISDSNDELDRLGAQLKELRKNHKGSEKRAQFMLQQIEQVIAKSKLQMRKQRRHHHKSAPLNTEVSELRELSSELSSPLSFVQAGMSGGDAPGNDAVLALQADKQELVKQSGITTADFDKQEKELLDLIELERGKLKELGASLKGEQPSLADKLKQAAELNRTIVASKRSVERDQSLLQSSRDKCEFQATSFAELIKQRSQAMNDIRMGAALLGKLDTATLLAKDLQVLKKDHELAFVQVAAHARRSQTKRSMSTFTTQNDDEPPALLQAADMGPFDDVTQMIRTLMQTMKDQANEDVNKHQFCQDSIGQNRREQLNAKNAVDTASSTILWANTAITRLADQIEYLGDEVARLKDVDTVLKTEFDDEKKIVDTQKKDHKLTQDVLTKVSVVLNQLCDLGSFLQQEAVGKTHSRFAQCAEAAKLLADASTKMKDLDDTTAKLFNHYEMMSKFMQEMAGNAETGRTTDLRSAKSLHANRVEELTTAKGDLKDKTNDMKIIQTAQSELEQNCGPGTPNSHEDRMARRQDEIDALKNAYNVLDGEGIPV